MNIKHKNIAVVFAIASFIIAQIANYLWFYQSHTAYSVFPICLLSIFCGVIAIKLGAKVLGSLAIISSLPSALMSGLIILFFGLGFSR